MGLEKYHTEETTPFFPNQPELRKSDADKYFNMGNELNNVGKKIEALQCYEKVIRIDPDRDIAYFKMGIIYKALGRPKEAISCYQKALAITPDSANIYFNMANSWRELGRTEDALFCYQKVIAIKPNDSGAYRNLGHILKEQNRLDEAMAHYLKAIALNPASPGLYVDLGGIYYQQEEFQKALSCCRMALSLDPVHVDAYYNLGITLEVLGRFEEAIAAYSQALSINPDHGDATWNRALSFLLLGNFENGWKGYENRIHISDWKDCYPYKHGLPKWNGTSFTGKKLYVHDEQGIGDTFQFIRYLPMVKDRGGTVIFETSKQLFGLLMDFDGIDRLVERLPNGEPEVRCDCYIPLLSLPRIFGTAESTIPCKVPYLFADDQKVRYWQDKVPGPGFKVGIVWRGNPKHKKDKSRSCALKYFSKLCTIPNIRIFGIQKGEAAKELNQVPGNTLEINLGPELDDFTDTAGLIANLDLVISVDTSVAHLVGAMGKPVWVLLPFVPDWRWMLSRSDSPWYPTMRLFRQNRRNDWGGVIEQVVHELQLLLKSTSKGKKQI